MSDWKKITVADVEMLRVNYQQRITESYLDDYKHMNVIMFCFTNLCRPMWPGGAKCFRVFTL
jgi:hypothetical protein